MLIRSRQMLHLLQRVQPQWGATMVLALVLDIVMDEGILEFHPEGIQLEY